MKDYIILAAIIVICLVSGFLIGRFGMKRTYDGDIIIEPTEDTDRDAIRFVLNLELDEIEKKQHLVFKVRNHLSQKSQPV